MNLKRNMYNKWYLVLLTLVVQSCNWILPGLPPEPTTPTTTLPAYSATPEIFPVVKNAINEASGLARSVSMPGNFWVIEDGNNSAALHMISGKGEYLGNIPLPLYNRDWEDLGTGPGPKDGVNYIYISETGDNQEVYGSYTIVRVEEPKSLDRDAPVAYETIDFTYPDVSGLDVEAFLIDPLTKDIYLISKRQLFNVRVYRLKYPYNPTGVNTAEFMGTIRQSFITAADISADGKLITLKNEDAIYMWMRKDGESVFNALSRSRDLGAPYYVEPQGEAISFSNTGYDYYTISEIANADFVNFYHYLLK